MGVDGRRPLRRSQGVTFGVIEAVAYVAHVVPSCAPKRVSDRVDGTEKVYGDFPTMFRSPRGVGATVSLEKDVSNHTT